MTSTVEGTMASLSSTSSKQPAEKSRDSRRSQKSLRIQKDQAMTIYAKQDLKLQSKMVEADGDSENEQRYVKFELEKPITFFGVTYTEAFWSPIYCTHSFARYLSHASAFLSLATVILIPYFIAFENANPASPLIQIFASGFYFVELGLNLFHIVPADLIPSLRETHTKPSIFETRILIFKHWIYKEPWWLLLFFLTALPWGLASVGSGLRNRYATSTLNVLRIYYIYRGFQKAFHNIDYNYYATRIFQFILSIFITTHWFACSFYVVALTNPNFDTTWLYVALNSKPTPIAPITSSDYYMLSLYWSFTTSCTVGYGDITPQNTDEYALVVSYFLFNIFMMAWVVGNVTLLVTQGNEATFSYRREFIHMEKYIKKFQLPPDLRDEMYAHMVLQFDLDKEFSTVPDSFPEPIRSKIQRTLYRPVIEACLFGVGSNAFIEMLCRVISIEVLLPGTEVVRRFDPSLMMYVLIDGSVEIFVDLSDDEAWLDTMEEGPTETVKAIQAAMRSASRTKKTLSAGTLFPGDTFGEEAFFFGLPQPFTVQTTTMCRFITLGAEEWEKVSNAFPLDARLVEKRCVQQLEAKIESLQLPPRDSSSAGSDIGWDQPSRRSEDEEDSKDADGLVIHMRRSSSSSSGFESDSVDSVDDDSATRGVKHPAEGLRPPAAAAISAAAISAASAAVASGPERSTAPSDTGTPKPSRDRSLFAVMRRQSSSLDLLKEGAIEALAKRATGGDTGISGDVIMVYESLLETVKVVCKFKILDKLAVFTHAASVGDVHKMALLVYTGFDVNMVDLAGRCPLHAAALRGSGESVAFLIAAGATVNIVDAVGVTPLFESLRCGHDHIAEELCAAGAKLGLVPTASASLSSQCDSSSLMFQLCSSTGKLAELERFLTYGLDANSHDLTGRTGLHVAARSGRVDAIRCLLEHGANPSQVDLGGCSPLLEAVRAKHEDCARELAAAGAQLGLFIISMVVDKQSTHPHGRTVKVTTSRPEGKTSIRDSAMVGAINKLTFPTDFGRTVQLYAWSEMYAAVLEGGSHDYLRLLLKFGCPVNAADYEKRTAAHVCCSLNLLQAALVLLEFKADFTSKAVLDTYGVTPLEVAEGRNHTKLAQTIRMLASRE